MQFHRYSLHLSDNTGFSRSKDFLQNHFHSKRGLRASDPATGTPTQSSRIKDDELEARVHQLTEIKEQKTQY